MRSVGYKGLGFKSSARSTRAGRRVVVGRPEAGRAMAELRSRPAEAHLLEANIQSAGLGALRVRHMAVHARSQWIVGAERVVDENRHIRLSTVEVTLPNGAEFTQYVVRMLRCAMTLVLDDENRALLVYRHRFIIDRWVWELPGGYIDDIKDIAVAAAREVEEETGWQPGRCCTWRRFS
jgi:hypothetical protein